LFQEKGKKESSNSSWEREGWGGKLWMPSFLIVREPTEDKGGEKKRRERIVD